MKRVALLLLFAAPAFAQHISPNAIAAHMRFLADDLLEGREPGTRGFDIAAEYVTAQFAAAGLQPMNASWLQPIAFRAARVTDQSMSINGEALTHRKDFSLWPNLLKSNVDLTAPVAAVGFGIVAPELHHDDYANVDVRGKIVLVVTGAPASFPNDQRAYYSGTALKISTAAEHGATGVLFVNSDVDEKRVPFAKRVQQDALPSRRYLDREGRPADAIESMQVTGRVSRDVADRLQSGATVAARVVSSYEPAKSGNVIGLLRGSDPKLRDQYVVVSAHLDHLGNHTPSSGTDSIYNGAYDNAAGIACLIEIARALAPHPPRRSVLFVAFTGEESGEQGSKYFARNPPVPRAALAADINMDMPLMLFPIKDLIALGGEHTTLGPAAERAAHDVGLIISPDPLPEEVRFIRSDQFAFVQQGIPAIHLKPGNKSTDLTIDGADITRDWLRRIYHSPADDMSQHFDFASGAKYAETNLRMVRAIADAPARPKWNAGDFFANTFAPR